MKKGLINFIFLLLILVVSLSFISSQWCTNLEGWSDLDRQANSKGSICISNCDKYNWRVDFKTDYCKTTKTVHEYDCINNQVVETDLSCGKDSVCKGGKCIKAETSTTSTNQQTTSTTNIKKSTQNNSNSTAVPVETTLRCRYGDVWEFTKTVPIKMVEDCKIGCKDGKCIKENNETNQTTNCVDSDSYNYYNKGYVFLNDIRYYDVCHSPSKVREYVCVNGEKTNLIKYCEYGCKDGACVNSTTNNQTGGCNKNTDCEVKEFCNKHNNCVSLSSEITNCIDSDRGYNYYNKGNIKGNGHTIWDVCEDNKKVREYVCVNSKGSSISKYCEEGCQNGACVKKPVKNQTTNYSGENIPPKKNITKNSTTNSSGKDIPPKKTFRNWFRNIFRGN